MNIEKKLDSCLIKTKFLKKDLSKINEELDKLEKVLEDEK